MTTLRLTTRGPAAAYAIARCENFTTYGALRGQWTDGVTYGQLPQAHIAQLLTDRADNGGRVYVVYSYATPIAWYTTAYGWRVPQVRHSVTTSKHQGHLYRITVAA